MAQILAKHKAKEEAKAKLKKIKTPACQQQSKNSFNSRLTGDQCSFPDVEEALPAPIKNKSQSYTVTDEYSGQSREHLIEQLNYTKLKLS